MNKRSLKSQLPNSDRLLPQEQRWLSAMLNNNNRKRLAVNFDRKIVKWFIARHNTNVFVYLKRGCKILAPDQTSNHVISAVAHGVSANRGNGITRRETEIELR